ncbi:MAG: glucose-6-phosphate isomerase [Candidatus Diapherotrites archaeon]|nr:glucose-6-phosphate isomerase [Candidatus Diapherotrites archaeon]
MGIVSGFNLSKITPGIRHVSEMKDVLFDTDWLKSQKEDHELYYMYRNVSKSREDLKKIEKNNLRFDITVIPPFMLGKEYVKTAGHYHPKVPGTDLSFTEVYEVLEGEAVYTLQKIDENESSKVADFKIIHAKAGDHVLIPPNYAHVTINTCNKTLIMANWVSSKFSSNYEPIKNLHGIAYYLVKGNKWIENPAYSNYPEPQVCRATDFSAPGLEKDKLMYEIIHKNPVLLDFLNRPQDFSHLWKKISR